MSRVHNRKPTVPMRASGTGQRTWTGARVFRIGSTTNADCKDVGFTTLLG
jgi:hypothetical protein